MPASSVVGENSLMIFLICPETLGGSRKEDPGRRSRYALLIARELRFGKISKKSIDLPIDSDNTFLLGYLDGFSKLARGDSPGQWGIRRNKVAAWIILVHDVHIGVSGNFIGQEAHGFSGAGQPFRKDKVPDQESSEGNSPFIKQQVSGLPMHLF
jgi:hypothetical protein